MGNKFNIGDRVWLNLPESETGVVVDIIYRFSTKKFEYSVCYSWGGYCSCEEYELIDSKVFK